MMTSQDNAVDCGRNIVTTLNYYDDPGDGSQPEPVYVKKYRQLRHSAVPCHLILANQG